MWIHCDDSLDFGYTCKNNLWLLKVLMKILMKKMNICHPLLVDTIDGWQPNYFYNYIFYQLYIDD
jgi:hypothetical protein